MSLRCPASLACCWNVLAALNADLPPIDAHEIVAESGYAKTTVWSAVDQLIAAGYVSHPRKRHIVTTERGRIALAVHIGREYRRRSRGPGL